MGDFNKNQASGPKSEKNKIMVAGALGVVLAGMGIFHLLKGGPQSAEAAGPNAVANDLAPPSLTPDQARTALSDDPTCKLLLPNAATDTSLSNVPNNPFLMATAWRGNLGKGGAVHYSGSGQNSGLDPSQYKITGIFRQGQKLYAIINGQIVTTNGVVDNARVTEIKVDHVALQQAQSPQGAHLVLTINPTLK